MSALVTEHLPLLAGAPNGIAKLRELVYALATSGSLIEDDTGAVIKPLGQLAEFVMGQAPPGRECNKNGDGYPFVKTGEFGPLFPEVREWTTKPLKFAKNGDVLICVVGATVGKLNLGIDCAIGRSVAAIRPLNGLSTDYLYCSLMPFTLKLRAQSRGSAQGVIGKTELSSVPIRFVPESVQHRIVAKVDELMALCDRLEARQADAESAHAQLVEALLGSLTKARDANDFATSWQRLSQHFQTLFTTESSIDALKQTVLQLAMMGKLVPQDDDDEPVTEFLKSVSHRKFGLATDDRLKRQNVSAAIGEEEKPFELPASWQWIRLEAIAQIGTGATPLRTNPNYFNPATINWVTSGETSQEFISTTEQRVSPLALAETNLTVYPPNTLIIAMYGQGKTRGQISELMIEACTNQACAAIQLFVSNDFHRQYVKYFFVKSYDDIRLLAAGGAQPNLNLGKIKEAVMPLPPLGEQSRIVAKVDQLVALCDQLKTRLTQARQLNQQLASTLVEQAVA